MLKTLFSLFSPPKKVKKYALTIQDLLIHVESKPIKTFRIKISHRSVSVSAPLSMSKAAVHQSILLKWEWILRQTERFNNHPPKSPIQMIHGETHYFLGLPYTLNIIEHKGPAKINLTSTLDLYVKPDTPFEKRIKVLQNWYRKELKKHIPLFIDKWEPILGVKVNEWNVKQMKTRWGTCNIRACRIWLSLELAKKPIECLEYVTLHELVHLLERNHTKRFHAYMDRFMPNWRHHQSTLKLSQ